MAVFDPDKQSRDALNRGAGAYSTPGVDTREPDQPFVPGTATPVARFKFVDVDPPSFLYVRPPDALNLRVNSLIAGGDVATFIVRILRADGTIAINQYRVVSTVPGVGVNSPQSLPEGYLLSVEASGSGATLRGQTFVQATLRHVITSPGATPDDQVLFADYVTNTTLVGWPGNTPSQPTDRNGHLRSITGTLPAAGAEIVETVPTATRWRLLAFRYSLTTAVAAANRESNLNIDDGVNIYITDTPSQTQVASTTFAYSYQIGVQKLAALQANVSTIPLPNIIVEAGHRIRTITANIQGADAYTAPQYLVEEWLTIG